MSGSENEGVRPTRGGEGLGGGTKGRTRASRTADQSLRGKGSATKTPSDPTVVVQEEDGGGSAALREAGKSWVLALDVMTSHWREEGHKVAFMWGRLEGDVAELEDHARRRGQDFVHVDFGRGSSGDPTSVWLAKFTRGKLAVDQDCELFRFNRMYPTELVTPTHRYRIEDDGRLKGRANDLDEMRAARVTKTFALWKECSAELAAERAAASDRDGHPAADCNG